MRYLSKRFKGEYGILRLIFLFLLILFGSAPATISLVRPDIDTKYLYIIAGGYALFSLIFFLIFYRNDSMGRSFKDSLKIVFLSIISIYILSFLLDLIFKGKATTSQNQEAIESMLKVSFSPALVAHMVLLAPVVEEYTFREVLPGLFRKIFSRREEGLKDFLSLIFANIVFSLLHTPTDLYSFLTYFSIGFVLVMVRHFTNSLKLSALVHMTWNLLSVIILYFVL